MLSDASENRLRRLINYVAAEMERAYGLSSLLNSRRFHLLWDDNKCIMSDFGCERGLPSVKQESIRHAEMDHSEGGGSIGPEARTHNKLYDAGDGGERCGIWFCRGIDRCACMPVGRSQGRRRCFRHIRESRELGVSRRCRQWWELNRKSMRLL